MAESVFDPTGGTGRSRPWPDRKQENGLLAFGTRTWKGYAGGDAGPRWKATSSSGGSMSAVTVETALGAARRLASWESPGRAGAYPRARVVSDATVDDA